MLIKPKYVAVVLATAGTAFSSAIVLISIPTEAKSEDLFFALEHVLGPWLILDVLLVTLTWARGIAIAGVLMLALELTVFYGAYISPQSSTDVVAYVFKPTIQVFFLLPIGLLIGGLLDRRANKADGNKK